MALKTITALLLLFALIGAASAAAIYSENEGDNALGMAMEAITSDDDMVNVAEEFCEYKGTLCEACFDDYAFNCM